MENNRKVSAKTVLMETLERLLHKNPFRKYPSMNCVKPPWSAVPPFTRILKINTTFLPAAWSPKGGDRRPD